MEKILVRKSAPLKGEVCISGAKNAVLPIMAAVLLTEEKCVIHDTPALRDVEIMRDILKSMGVSIEDKPGASSWADYCIKASGGINVAAEAGKGTQGAASRYSRSVGIFSPLVSAIC